MTYLIVACAALLVSTQPVKLPDTPQTRVVLEFIGAFNDGTPADVESVLAKYRDPAITPKRTPEERAEANAQMREMFGKLTIDKLVSHSETEVVVVMPRLDGEGMVFTFTFAKTQPLRLMGIVGKPLNP